MTEGLPGAGALTGPLQGWMPQQRWFGGKGRSLSVTGVHEVAVLAGDPPVVLLVVHVAYEGGDTETYQVPVVLRRHWSDTLQHVHIGEIEGWQVYDALHDKEVTGRWLDHLDGGDRVGGVTFVREPDSPPLPLGRPSLVIGAEQSNTSLIYGDEAILKVFRKVADGTNPDIEIHSALHRAGSTHIATPLGWVEGAWPGADGREHRGSLAMLQRFLRTATDGWDLATTSVRDLFAEGDLHPDEVGGDFASEALRLGVATAEVHRDLAATLGTRRWTREDARRVAIAMRRRLDSAVAAVPDLAPYAPSLRTAYDAVAETPLDVAAQRVHGDYHLGQVMRTETGWVLLDFEGEPAKSLAERQEMSLPVRDVAGMLRSFDYAARQILADHPGDNQLRYRAGEWATRNRAAFCDGYAKAAGEDPRADGVLLRAYEIDKAVYEAVYEARNRPTWLPIPMAAIERLAQPDGGTT